MPVIATSHLWENGKNEQSHQDPTFGEALLGEMSDLSRVLYPADANSAAACLNACYQTQGQIWSLTIAKQPVANVFSAEQARQQVAEGALSLQPAKADGVQLVAVGSYQLAVCQQLQAELTDKGIDSQISCLLEPGRFRSPRDAMEAEFVASAELRQQLFPDAVRLRVFVTHMRPESLLGVCRPLDLGPERCLAFGYQNQGGTLDTPGLLQANGCDAAASGKRICERLGVSEESAEEICGRGYCLSGCLPQYKKRSQRTVFLLCVRLVSSVRVRL